MEEIIARVPRELIKAELTEERKLRRTNKSGNDVYIVTWQDAPNTLREIGRLREIAFRAAGGGSGKSMDLDEFDTCENPYKQLIVWDPEEEEILGGYRYILGRDWQVGQDGQPHLATSHMFRFSEQFMRDYAPYTVELGRSFVTLEYQSSRMGTKGLFALDNLWDGLGAISVIYPNVRYFFGKFTMYPSFDRLSRDMILYFLHKHFPDPDCLIEPNTSLHYEHDTKQFETLITEDDFKKAYRILNKAVRERGLNIPPLVIAYMGRSPTMKLFGTAVNDGFGNVEESGILIAIDEILEEKRMRYIDSFAAEHPEFVNFTSGANKVFYTCHENEE